MTTKKFPRLPGAIKALEAMSAKLGTDEFTIVENPSYIYRPFDIYPIPPAVKTPRKRLVAIVKDMDGTTTTTEELCVHSLEFMVGRITGNDLESGWTGIERHVDHDHIIGNSTTMHVQYLVNKYGGGINLDAFRRAYWFAVLWTLAEGRDPGREQEVRAGLAAFGLGRALESQEVRDFLSAPYDKNEALRLAGALQEKYSALPELRKPEHIVRAAIDVYYQRYHEILGEIARGRGDTLAASILGRPGAHLIEPMPAVAVFLAAVKGWLGEHLAVFEEELFVEYRKLAERWENFSVPEDEMKRGAPHLADLGRWFEKHPLKVAVVTSSIAYEARIVLGEVFKILQRQAASWNIPGERRALICEHFRSFEKTYDAFITASDSSEIRLKPHPDLYSIALNHIGVAKEDFDAVAGFEDSESGTRAIRTAGIGLSVAVPFPFTKNHDLSAAAWILPGGLPETILRHLVFMDPAALK